MYPLHRRMVCQKRSWLHHNCFNQLFHHRPPLSPSGHLHLANHHKPYHVHRHWICHMNTLQLSYLKTYLIPTILRSHRRREICCGLRSRIFLLARTLYPICRWSTKRNSHCYPKLSLDIYNQTVTTWQTLLSRPAMQLTPVPGLCSTDYSDRCLLFGRSIHWVFWVEI